jgi:hypothetical protein
LVAKALVAELTKSNIKSSLFPRGILSTMPRLPTNLIIVHVGPKPIGAYFLKKIRGDPKDSAEINLALCHDSATLSSLFEISFDHVK